MLSEQHYVRASQLATVLITIVSAVVTFYMDSIAGAWKLLILTGAGTGSVLLLRWYWWRINAWSEVSAMISAFVVSVAMQTAFGFDSAKPVDEAWIMLITVAITTVVWLAVTFLTKPESNDTLVAFYRRTAPSVTGWGPIAALAPDVKPRQDGLSNLLDWICGCVLIYGSAVRGRQIVASGNRYGLGFARVGHCSRRCYLLGSLPPRLVLRGRLAFMWV